MHILKFEQTSLLSRQWFDKLLIDEQRDPILFSESSVGNLVDVFRWVYIYCGICKIIKQKPDYCNEKKQLKLVILVNILSLS